MTPEDRKTIIEALTDAAELLPYALQGEDTEIWTNTVRSAIASNARALALLRAELEKQEPVGKDPVSIAIARNNAGLMDQRGRAITWHGPVSTAQEPVAWAIDTGRERPFLTDRKDLANAHAHNGMIVVPLYTHPQ